MLKLTATMHMTDGGADRTMRLRAGETDTLYADIETVALSHGVTAVVANCLSAFPLKADCGVTIDITPSSEIESFMAEHNDWAFWCRPVFGTSLTEVPDDAQALVAGCTDGEYLVILPVVNDTYKCILEGTESGLRAKLVSWYDRLLTCKGLAFVYAKGADPFALMEHCTEEALAYLGTGVRTRKERRYPEIFEYLGWCSWDSMQIRVNEEGIITKCREFQEKNIPVRWALFDDMWATVSDFYGKPYENFDEMVALMHRSSLDSFEADPLRFPNGLKGCINKVKAFGLSVGIWHPTTGYWSGLTPGKDAYNQVKDCLIEASDGRYIHDYHTDKAYRFYRTFHSFLRSCGADFIKIDNQSMIRKYSKGLAPVGQIARQIHDGMEASVGQHFDNAMINCMGMSSEDMWTRTVSPISRCSGDFLPENSAWFSNHVTQCAYNSFVQGQFYYCDWDMWWTDDGQAVKNSLLRAISGGPVYISDMLGRSKAELLAPLATSDGKILRCDRPAMPTKDCLTVDPTRSGKVFKVQNTANGSGVLAVLNISNDG
ncbi:MAG: hypothetical protein IJ367_03420, partial [Clostridia bacterium]|nr:hypothetical protein [Clostridia bacterium]